MCVANCGSKCVEIQIMDPGGALITTTTTTTITTTTSHMTMLLTATLQARSRTDKQTLVAITCSCDCSVLQGTSVDYQRHTERHHTHTTPQPVYLSLGAELHVLHPLTVALELGQRLSLHPLVQLHGLLQRLDPPLQVHLIADLALVLEHTCQDSFRDVFGRIFHLPH